MRSSISFSGDAEGGRSHRLHCTLQQWRSAHVGDACCGRSHRILDCLGNLFNSKAL
ncbi:MAG: hypothetical protein ACYT04_41680 [Nostoc sp.]